MSADVFPSNERGFASVWVIGFAMLILVTGIVFFQFGSVLIERQKLVTAADRAANAGATALDEDELINSDGETVQLDETEAVQRCNEAIVKESGGQASPTLNAESSGCVLSADRRTVIATVKGNVSLGVISSWLGIDEKEFTVVSKSRPTCSSTDDTPGDGTC